MSEEGSDFGQRSEKIMTDSKRISAPVDFSEFEFIEDDTLLKDKRKSSLAQSAHELSR